MHLYVDGRPFRDVWRDHARGYVQSLDANQDGRIDRAEAQQARPSLASLAAGAGSTEGNASLARFVAERPAGAPLEECLRWQETTADGPFSVTESAAAALSDGALLELIDADRDRRLSRVELGAAIDVLRRRDFDNNEALTRNELISGAALYQSVSPRGEVPPAASGPDEQRPANADRTGDDRSRFLLIVHAQTSPAEIAGAILDRYDRDGNRRLTCRLAAREVALGDELFAALDHSGDDALDIDELGAFAARAPDVELSIQFGQLSAEVPALASAGTALSAGMRIRARSDGSYKLELPDATVDLRRDNRHPTKNRAQEIDFRSFDADANGYLDAPEAARVIGKAPLALLDADNDGMVQPAEFEAFVTREGDAAGARLVLALTGEGQNLFEQIDANFDGGLTPRELRTAAEQLANQDLNGDGYLDGDELPQQVGLLLARGRLRLADMSNSAALRRPRGTVRVEEEVGPGWFRKMDRNRDGDVSPREFLGTAAQFEHFDANRDGLIAADEAEARGE
ncbi:MAG: hypothetical protein JNG90_18410 [Planctomycetaceae bacterium]|nr:hypothetical protein [Planctomycetaceae bacterium]